VLDAVSEKLAERVAPKLKRLRTVKGDVRELREDRAALEQFYVQTGQRPATEVRPIS
jgi:hypothetical protein